MSERTTPPPFTAVGRDASRLRIAGLDSIRFVCAAIVMIGHIGLIPGRLEGQSHGALGKIAAGLWNSAFNGPAAVIVFFVISGFCIHFPYRERRPVHLMSFYTRRAVRILLPALCFVTLLRLAFHQQTAVGDTVLWSVICEFIYYVLYPGLLWLRRRSSWAAMIASSAVLALAVIVLNRAQLPYGDNAYVALGPHLTWIVGLPCWLLGCWLAESFSRFTVPSPMQMWSLRFGIWSLSVVANLLRFHSHGLASSSTVLLDLMAAPIAFWLGYEIAFLNRHGANRLLEGLGTWSYSLYLIHTVTGPLLTLAGLAWIERRPATHPLVLLLAPVLSYIYFLIVERPSHRLAIFLSRFPAVFNAPSPVYGLQEGSPIASTSGRFREPM